jgi:hypothetical protein
LYPENLSLTDPNTAAAADASGFVSENTVSRGANEAEVALIKHFQNNYRNENFKTDKLPDRKSAAVSPSQSAADRCGYTTQSLDKFALNYLGPDSRDQQALADTFRDQEFIPKQPNQNGNLPGQQFFSNNSNLLSPINANDFGSNPLTGPLTVGQTDNRHSSIARFLNKDLADTQPLDTTNRVQTGFSILKSPTSIQTISGVADPTIRDYTAKMYVAPSAANDQMQMQNLSDPNQARTLINLKEDHYSTLS